MKRRDGRVMLQPSSSVAPPSVAGHPAPAAVCCARAVLSTARALADMRAPRCSRSNSTDPHARNDTTLRTLQPASAVARRDSPQAGSLLVKPCASVMSLAARRTCVSSTGLATAHRTGNWTLVQARSRRCSGAAAEPRGLRPHTTRSPLVATVGGLRLCCWRLSESAGHRPIVLRCVSSSRRRHRARPSAPTPSGTPRHRPHRAGAPAGTPDPIRTARCAGSTAPARARFPPPEC